jgi:hypothetical protein
MAKYLDSKGLSYLWQKIKAELATKSDNHEHPYVKNDTVIKLGSTDATGISLVTPTEGKEASWTIPFAGVEQAGLVKGLTADETAGLDVADGFNSWHIAPVIDGHVYYQNTLADVNTVTAASALTNNKVVLGADSKGIKVSTYEIGAESYTTPATFGGANLLATEAAVKGYVDDLGSAVSSNYIHATVASDEKILDIAYADTKQEQPILKTTLGINYDATAQQIQLLGKNNEVIDSISAAEFVKDGMIESVQILKRDNAEGDASITWTTLDGTEFVSEVINAPEAEAGSIWLYFVWNADVDADGTKEGVQRKVSWLPATELIKDCSADDTRGIGSVPNTDGGHEFYVKTSENSSLSLHNVSTGFDEKGNVVGYVDLSDYQKSADLQAFTKEELDKIFDDAEADLTVNKGVPTFPADPLVKE